MRRLHATDLAALALVVTTVAGCGREDTKGSAPPPTTPLATQTPVATPGGIPKSAETLFEAAEKGAFDSVRRLVESGAPLSATNADGKTALFLAVRDEPTLDGGSLVLGGDGPRVSARTASPSADRIRIVEYLIERKADVNARDAEGNTPLFDASTAEMVRCLTAKGAEVNAANKGGQSPLHLAMARLFIDSGAAEVLGDHSPYLDRIKALVDAGARVNAKDTNGHTPLDYGIRGFAMVPPEGGIDSHPAIQYLRSKGAKTSQ